MSRAADHFKVDQEAVTADEKETDIRLRSTGSEHGAVIELKIRREGPVSIGPTSNSRSNTWQAKTAVQVVCLSPSALPGIGCIRMLGSS